MFGKKENKERLIGKNLPPESQKLMTKLSKVLGVESFILFGGLAIDMLIDFPMKKRDFDIAIKRKSGYVEKCKANLEKSNYRVIGSDRQYFINLYEPIVNVFVENNNSVLDIAFMDDVSHVGQFDIESLFYRYPELDYIDRYSAFRAIKNKTMRPIHGLNKENPYLLANRIINLCAKYEMKLSENIIHSDSIKILKKRIRAWDPLRLFDKDILQDFHGRMARIAHYSTVLKAIERANNRALFVEDLLSTELLLETIPEIQEPLKKLSSQQKKCLNELKNKKQIANFLVKIVAPGNQKILRQKFSLLRLRNWDLEDQKVNV